MWLKLVFVKTWILFKTSLGTQRCPGYWKLLRRLPALELILPGNYIFAIEVDLLNIEFQNQTKNISVVLPSSPIKNLRQIGPEVPELWSDKQRLQLYIYRYTEKAVQNIIV